MDVRFDLSTATGSPFAGRTIFHCHILEHEDGVGTIWLAIPKNHDLDTGPVTPVVVLAPDVVTPV